VKAGAHPVSSVATQNVTETIIQNNMSKFNHYCPFCKQSIPKVYLTRTITKNRKRGKIRTKVVKEVIGEDWSTHTQTCSKLKEFLNNTK